MDPLALAVLAGWAHAQAASSRDAGRVQDQAERLGRRWRELGLAPATAQDLADIAGMVRSLAITVQTGTSMGAAVDLVPVRLGLRARIRGAWRGWTTG